MASKRKKSKKITPKKWDSSAHLRDVLSGKFLAPGNSKVKKVKAKKKKQELKKFKTEVNKLRRKSKLKTSVYRKNT